MPRTCANGGSSSIGRVYIVTEPSTQLDYLPNSNMYIAQAVIHVHVQHVYMHVHANISIHASCMYMYAANTGNVIYLEERRYTKWP